MPLTVPTVLSFNLNLEKLVFLAKAYVFICLLTAEGNSSKSSAESCWKTFTEETTGTSSLGEYLQVLEPISLFQVYKALILILCVAK